MTYGLDMTAQAEKYRLEGERETERERQRETEREKIFPKVL